METKTLIYNNIPHFSLHDDKVTGCKLWWAMVQSKLGGGAYSCEKLIIDVMDTIFVAYYGDCSSQLHINKIKKEAIVEFIAHDDTYDFSKFKDMMDEYFTE